MGRSPSHRERSRSPRRRSRSRSPKRSRSHRSRSPIRDYNGSYSRSRFNDGRENPDPNSCLGVFGMSLHTSERDLKKIFGQYGEIDSVQIVCDRISGRSRGFGFVYFTKTRDATRAKENLRDAVIDGMKVRVDYSVTKSGHSSYRYKRARSPPRRSCVRSRSITPRNQSVSRSHSRTFSEANSAKSSATFSRSPTPADRVGPYK